MVSTRDNSRHYRSRIEFEDLKANEIEREVREFFFLLTFVGHQRQPKDKLYRREKALLIVPKLIQKAL